MSFVNKWPYVEGPVTIWPTSGTDEWGQPVGAPPYIIPYTDYAFGGDVRRDDSGSEFIPRITIWFKGRFEGEPRPDREWYLMIGDHTNLALPPNAAERIRTVFEWPMNKFSELPEWEITT